MIFGAGLALEAIKILEENEKMNERLQNPNYLYTKLKKHCANGNIAKIEKILELPKDFNFPLDISFDGLSALSSALLAHQYETFNFLTGKGVCLNINDLISLYMNEKEIKARNEIINVVIDYFQINFPKDHSLFHALYLLGCADNNIDTLMKLHETGIKPVNIQLCDSNLNSSLDFPQGTIITPIKMALKNKSHAALKILADFSPYPLQEIESILKYTGPLEALTKKKFIRQTVHRTDLDDLAKFPELKKATNSVIANTIIQLMNSAPVFGQLPLEIVIYYIMPYVFPSQHYEKSFFFTDIQLSQNVFTTEEEWRNAKNHLMGLQK